MGVEDSQSNFKKGESLQPANSTGPYLSFPSSLRWLMLSWTMKHLNRNQQCTKNNSIRLIPVAEQHLASLLTSAALAFSTPAMPQPICSHHRTTKTAVYNSLERFLPWNINLPIIMASTPPMALLFKGTPPWPTSHDTNQTQIPNQTLIRRASGT